MKRLAILTMLLLGPGCGDDDGSGNSNQNQNQSTCGNGVVELGEQCDEGPSNSDTAPNGCRTTCRNAYCGDGVADSGEACDDGSSEDSDGCSAGCLVEVGWECTAAPSACQPICGDDLAVGDEQCDGADLREHTCQTMENKNGQLQCWEDCTFNTSWCGKEPVITAVEGEGLAVPIAPRTADEVAAIEALTDPLRAERRIGTDPVLALTGQDIQTEPGDDRAEAVGQNGQGTIQFEVLPGGTATMARIRMKPFVNVTQGGLFLLTLLTANGPATAAVFILQGRDGNCTNVIQGDLTVNGSVITTGNQTVGGKLTVTGSIELPSCPSGYEEALNAPAGVTLCVDPNGDQMVKVGDIWVDRYEATVFDNPICDDPTNHAYGSTVNDWHTLAPGFTPNGNWAATTYACSVPGHIPSHWVSWFMAQAACAGMGKRLITNAEWQMAVQGAVDPGAYDGSGGGACHTSGADARAAGLAGNDPGSATSCISRWGVEDQIGNLSEWTADWVPGGHDPNWSTTDYERNPWGTGYGGDYTWGFQLGYATGLGWAAGLPTAIVRGGYWGHGTKAGSFEAEAWYSPSHQGDVIAFRCARSR